MHERFIESSEDALPAWFSQEEADDFVTRRDLIADLERAQGIDLEKRLMPSMALAFLKKNPDARQYLAFHIISGSSNVSKEALVNFDYPDGAISRLVSERLLKLSQDKNDKIRS